MNESHFQKVSRVVRKSAVMLDEQLQQMSASDEQLDAHAMMRRALSQIDDHCRQLWKDEFLEDVAIRLDLSAADLSGGAFTGLREGNVQGIEFRHCPLDGADLRGANLDKTRWTVGFQMHNANLTGASLRECTLLDPSFKGSVFREADLSGAFILVIGRAPADFTGANFTGAEIKILGPSWLGLEGAKMDGCRVSAMYTANQGLSNLNKMAQENFSKFLSGLSAEQRAKIIVEEPVTPSSRGGSCFIATAAYGSSLAHEVEVLRLYRDQKILVYPSGRAFVWLYECVSPPLARWIGRHRVARWVTRTLLVAPFVKLIKRETRSSYQEKNGK